MLFSIQVLKRSAHRLCRGSASSPHIPRACLFVDAPQLFDPGSIQGQSKHSVQTSRKCNFDLLFPNPKSAEITQQPRHGARVGGQPSAPLRCVPLGPASGSAISPSRRALCLLLRCTRRVCVTIQDCVMSTENLERMYRYVYSGTDQNAIGQNPSTQHPDRSPWKGWMRSLWSLHFDI